jgi:hypothetical protein
MSSSSRVEVTTLKSAFTDDRYVEDKRRVSSWMITVNPNKTYESKEQAAALISRLLSVTTRIFGGDDEDPEFLEDVLIWKEMPQDDNWRIEVIRKPEIGKIMGRIHIHVYVTIRHTGKIQLNYRKLGRLYREFLRPLDGPYSVRDPEDKREALYDTLGITGIYVDIRHVKHADGALHYLEKGQEIFEKEPEEEKLPFATYEDVFQGKILNIAKEGEFKEPDLNFKRGHKKSKSDFR